MAAVAPPPVTTFQCRCVGSNNSRRSPSTPRPGVCRLGSFAARTVVNEYSLMDRSGSDQCAEGPGWRLDVLRREPQIVARLFLYLLREW
jgi:hypothetical protein